MLRTGGMEDAAQDLCCLPLKCMDVPGQALLVDLVEAGLGSGCVASVIASLGHNVRRGPGIFDFNRTSIPLIDSLGWCVVTDDDGTPRHTLFGFGFLVQYQKFGLRRWSRWLMK